MSVGDTTDDSIIWFPGELKGKNAKNETVDTPTVRKEFLAPFGDIENLAGDTITEETTP